MSGAHALLLGTVPFNPANLFAGSIPGAWYDPTDLSTMFQDSTGTTPVTAVEQPVGLILDKSQGLALGAELVTNGDFSSGASWVLEPGWAIGAGLATKTAGVAASIYQPAPAMVQGRTYLVTFTVSGYTAGILYPVCRGTLGTGVTANGTYTQALIAGATAARAVEFFANATFAGSLDNVTVRELAGNHASQSTAASRPTYRARYNMVEQSEAFNNAWWTKSSTTISADAGAAPDGTATADLVYPTTTGTARIVWRNLIAGINGQRYTLSVYAKASGKAILYFGTLQGNTAPDADLPFFNLTTGQVSQAGAHFDTVTIQSVGSGWYRCTATKNAVTSANLYPIFGVADASGNTTATTNGTDGVLLWGAQLLTAADVTATGNAYQRIAAATVYDTAPVFRPYLAFDGMDDSLFTANVNFSTTDKMTMFAGVSKLSNLWSIICELTADGFSTPGGCYIGGSDTSGQPEYTFTSQGTYWIPNTYPAPITNVLTTSFDRAGTTRATEVIPRINGVVNQTNGGGTGAATGNMANAPLFIGRRNNTAAPLNGRLYSLIVRGAASSVTEIAETELWVNARTGAY